MPTFKINKQQPNLVLFNFFPFSCLTSQYRNLTTTTKMTSIIIIHDNFTTQDITSKQNNQATYFSFVFQKVWPYGTRTTNKLNTVNSPIIRVEPTTNITYTSWTNITTLSALRSNTLVWVKLFERMITTCPTSEYILQTLKFLLLS
jgi:hypothetical protein